MTLTTPWIHRAADKKCSRILCWLAGRHSTHVRTDRVSLVPCVRARHVLGRPASLDERRERTPTTHVQAGAGRARQASVRACRLRRGCSRASLHVPGLVPCCMHACMHACVQAIGLHNAHDDSLPLPYLAAS